MSDIFYESEGVVVMLSIHIVLVATGPSVVARDHYREEHRCAHPFVVASVRCREERRCARSVHVGRRPLPGRMPLRQIRLWWPAAATARRCYRPSSSLLMFLIRSSALFLMTARSGVVQPCTRHCISACILE